MSRLDTALADRGLARSRTHAAALIAEGLVTVDGAPVRKASHRVGDAARLVVAASDHYVSRGAHKLIAALDGFGCEVHGRLALDMGASTGGFTQVLRERGAHKVLALDVGHGQLAAPLREDPGVVSVEGFNVRFMTPETLREATGEPEAPDLIVGDLSFISLALVLPAAAAIAAPRSDVVLLIKPQFEVGRTAVRGGLVPGAEARVRAVEQVVAAAADAGLGLRGLLPSPILGTHGNAEYLAHFSPGAPSDPTQWRERIRELAGGR